MLLLLVGSGALAQNLNPTVEVTNTYRREAGGIDKPVLLLPAPDSVLRFRLDFDYSVKTTPYKGAYEFEPYQVQLRPMARPDGQQTFYLRAGAGYGFHPELTAVWTPVRKDHWRLNVFADHSSYMGYYRTIGKLSDGAFTHTKEMGKEAGCNSHSAVGVNTLFDWNGGSLTADLRYRNIIGAEALAGDTETTMYHGIGASVSACSNPSASFQWEASEKASWTFAPGIDFRETHTQTSLGAGMRMGSHLFKIHLDAETVGQEESYAGLVALTPRYVMSLGALRLDLGVRMSYLFHSQADFYHEKSDFVFPDVHISYGVIPESLVLQAAATGGDRMQVYSDWLETNPWMSNVLHCYMDNSVERFNLMAGARGQFWGRLHYDARVGYAFWKNALLWGFDSVPGSARPLLAMGYRNYHLFYVQGELGWKAEYLDAGLQLKYRKTDLSEEQLFAPAAWEGRAHALYNWGGRIWGGVDAEWMSRRVAQKGYLPGYVDLGLYGEYRMSRSLGLWLRVGNLLNQTVQRVPFHAENGIYGTVGIRWNF